ncbi:type VII secretion protein EsaA [Mammaliicoccus sp. Dog046]|uniref:type VII secretion protein EsaA n=1 Tax=Mammaliicoccus sp. Dog046 TaxID=3034233 RepID=UPI002B25671F|nr:type VII secretion protein EsaA [Mammaliicoccus sp. Dog046]WQK85580.1 type VII secretion protein EsaA [Mammaliicoccus sp. Dog046]
MKKKSWIYTLIIFLIVCITVASIVIFANGNHEDHTDKDTKSKEVKNKTIHMAIVNEDQATTYNDKKIRLGEPFINRLSQQGNYKFETVTRSMAETGLKNGTYQVMVVIPKNFSKLAMQLDEKTPSKMEIQYKTATGQKAKVAKDTEEIVGNVLKDFNKNLIQIYLTSIIDNLHNAQENVGDIMSREQSVNKKFSNYLLNPLNDFPSLFTDTSVNSTIANNDITTWVQQYNRSLLSANSDIFNVNVNENATSIVQSQNEAFNKNISLLEQTLSDYKSKQDSVNLNTYIDHLKEMDSQLDEYTKSEDRSKKEYQKTFEENLDELKKQVKKQESPFTKKMIEDYRKNLTKSITSQLDDNKELNDAVQQVKDDHQQVQDTMINYLREVIERDESKQDAFYIRNMSAQDLENAGLSEQAVKDYQATLGNVQQFIEEYNQGHPQNKIKQDDYNGEINATDTSRLVNEGVDFERKETIKSKDINQLSIATDPNFDFEGTVYVNGKKYDIKDQNIQLDTTVKSYDVEVKGVAKLKSETENQNQFLDDKTMRLQLLFGQADRNDNPGNNPSDTITDDNEANDNTLGVDTPGEDAEDDNATNDNEPNENAQDDSNKNTSVVDLSINHHLGGELISGDLDQQLRSLDRFQAQYTLYKDKHLSPGTPTIDNKAIANMMVDEVVKDMDGFKANKTDLLKQIDEMNDTSDELVTNILDSKESVGKNKKDIESLIDELSETEKTLSEEPEEPEIDRDSDETYTTLSSNLDKEVSKLSEKSQKLLSDSQTSKSTADKVSSQLNQLDSNVDKLHASGRSLGTRANDLNKEMSKNEDTNALFAKDFARVLENSKDGDRQNEALKAFMSQPIQKKSIDNVLADEDEKDTISSTILVLLMYLLSMMTAYLFYSYERAKGLPTYIKDDFSERNGLWNNMITSAIIGGTSIIEGMVIGFIALNRYQVMPGYQLKFMLMIIITMAVFVFINTYLLRQLKSIGMFIMIILLALYFIAIDGLGMTSSTLAQLSPLTYVDTMIYNYLNAEHPVGISLFVITVIAIIGFVLNIFVKHFKKERLI